MHAHVRAFIQSAVEAFDLRGPVYELGYCPNPGPSWRPPVCHDLPDETYLDYGAHCSLEVDRLEDLAGLPFADAVAGTVIAINSLEHVFEPHRAVAEMRRVLAPGGMLLVASHLDARSPHFLYRYWKPTPHAVQRLLTGFEATLIGWQGADSDAHTLLAIASKPPAPGGFAAGVGLFLDRFQRRLSEAAARVPWSRRLKRLLIGWLQNGTNGRREQDLYKAHFVLHLPVECPFKHSLLADCLPEENAGSRLDLSQ